MKRIIISVLIAALVLTAFAGCGSRENDIDPEVTPPVNTVTPEDNNGMVEDDNGIIGDTQNGDTGNEGVLPEIGNDIEQGADDIINGVDDAINGNSNNDPAGTDAGDNARGRMRTR